MPNIIRSHTRHYSDRTTNTRGKKRRKSPPCPSPIPRAQENCRIPALHAPSHLSNGVKSIVSPISPPLLSCPPSFLRRCTHRVYFRPISPYFSPISSTHPFNLIRVGEFTPPYAVLLSLYHRETCTIPLLPLFSLFFYRVRKMEKTGKN